MTGEVTRILGLAAALSFVPAFTHCVSYTDGIEVGVTFAPLDASHDTASAFVSAGGVPVVLDRAMVVVQSVDLEPCDGASPRTATRLLVLGPTHARAHTPASATRLSTPRVLTLGTPQHAGVFLPPPGRYCAVRVTFGAADADTPDLPKDPDMVGRTLHVDGMVGEPGEVLALRSAARHRVRVPLPAPLVLSEARRAAELTMGYRTAHAVASLEGDPAAFDFLAGLAGSFEPSAGGPVTTDR